MFEAGIGSPSDGVGSSWPVADSEAAFPEPAELAADTSPLASPSTSA